MRLTLALIFTLISLSGCGGGGASTHTNATSPPDEAYIVGFDVYLAQNHSKSCEWIDLYVGQPTLALTILWQAGAYNDVCLKKFLHDQRPTTLQLFVANGVCDRKRNCTEQERAALRDYGLANTIEALNFIRAESQGPIDIQIIVSLEDNMSYAQARDACLNLKHTVAGEAQIWRNPNEPSTHNFNDDCFDGVRLHNHHQFPTSYSGKCSWSNDGLDIDFPTGEVWSLPHRISPEEMLNQVRERRGDCDIYAWSASASNCLRRDSSEVASVDRRDCSSSDTNIDLIKALIERA
jgi:hypothetical protein